MGSTYTIPGTAKQLSLDRLLAALTPEDAAVLEWVAAEMRAYQRARGERARADATDALIAMLQQGIAEQQRAKGIAEAFPAKTDALSLPGAAVGGG